MTNWLYVWVSNVIRKNYEQSLFLLNNDVIKWKHFPRNWSFVRGTHRSPVKSPHKGQWCGALMFFFISVWINDRVNNREAGDLRRYRVHYDVIGMGCKIISIFHTFYPCVCEYTISNWKIIIICIYTYINYFAHKKTYSAYIPSFHGLTLNNGKCPYFRFDCENRIQAESPQTHIHIYIYLYTYVCVCVYIIQDDWENWLNHRHTTDRIYLTSILYFQAFRQVCILMIMRCTNKPIRPSRLRVFEHLYAA